MTWRKVAAGVVCALAAGCAEGPTGSDAVLAPGGALRSISPPASGSHSTALQNLVNSMDSVHITGTWELDSTVVLDTRTRLIGDGPATTRIVWKDTAWNTFPLLVDSQSDIAVRNIRFVGTPSPGEYHVRHQFALKIHGGSNVTFEGNRVEWIGMVGSFGSGNEAPPVGSPNYNLYVRDNVVDKGVCGLSRQPAGIRNCNPDQTENAIELGYVYGGEILRNHISRFNNGISINGGDPKTLGTSYEAGDILIQGNRVDQVNGGILSFQSARVNVFDNVVTNCSDTCLDVEGGNDVVFAGNTAKYGRNYVISSFYNTQFATFRQNHLHKGDRYVDENGDTSYVATNQLFHTASAPFGTDNRISIAIYDNDLVWEGSTTSQFGKVTKTHTRKFVFSNNRLTDVAVDLKDPAAGVYGGTVDLRGNTLTFTRPLGGQPGIRLGSNNDPAPGGSKSAEYVSDPWHVIVAGNVFTSPAPSHSGDGIYVEQTCGCKVNTLVEQNQVRGFPVSIRVIGGSDHHFAVVSNGTSGTVVHSQASNKNVSGNYTISN